jgi:hypothetical protein
MCTRCGRPQQAGAGRCAACGAELPEAPLPPGVGPAPSPFLSLELDGGRVLTGEDNRLVFRPGSSATPLLQELPRLRRLSLVRQPRLEALAVCAVALVMLLFVPWAPGRVLLALVILAGVAFATSWQRYLLLLTSLEGVETRWVLGTARRGSQKERRLLSAWQVLESELRARGVGVRGPPSGGRAPGA